MIFDPLDRDCFAFQGRAGDDILLACLTWTRCQPQPNTNPGDINWDHQKSGLAPGEVYSVVVTLKAEITCQDVLREATNLLTTSPAALRNCPTPSRSRSSCPW